MAMTDTTTTPGSLGNRLRESLMVVQTRILSVEERAKAQWLDIPGNLRLALDKLFERVRQSLDLPSRAEIASLAERLDDLDRKLAALEHARQLAPATTPDTLASTVKAVEQATITAMQAAAGADTAQTPVRPTTIDTAAAPAAKAAQATKAPAMPETATAAENVAAQPAASKPKPGNDHHGKSKSKSTKTVKANNANKTVKAAASPRPTTQPASDPHSSRRDKIKQAASSTRKRK